MTPSNKKFQSGNVMVIILIGIALFAALAYAIKGGSAPSSAVRTTAEANILADKIIAYGNAVEATVADLMGQGVQVHQIDFGSTVFKRWTSPTINWTSNANCASNTCRVFKSVGGTLPEVVFYPDATAPYTVSYSTDRLFPGHPAFCRVDVAKMGGASSNDIVMKIAALSTEVCEAINSKLGLPSAATSAQESYFSKGKEAHNAGVGDNYWSLDVPDASMSPLGDENTAIAGKTKGCVRIANLGNVYFHVMVTR